MKTVLKILAVLFVLLVLLIVAVLYWAASNIDSLVKTGIEKGGSYSLGVPTVVESVDVGLLAGTLDMDGLKVSNPSGFSTPHFIALGDSDITVDIGTITSDKVKFSEFTLKGIDVYLDKGGNPSNYNTILNNIKRFESGASEEPKNAEGANKAVVIDSLVLEDINIHVANMPGVSLLAGDVAVTIPRIELKGVGEKERMKAGDVASLVVKTVLSAAIEAGGGIIPLDVLNDLGSQLANLDSLKELGITSIGEVGGLLEGGIENFSTQAEEALEDLKTQGEDAIEDAKKEIEDKVNDAVDDAKNEIEKGINNILGGKKKKEDG